MNTQTIYEEHPGSAEVSRMIAEYMGRMMKGLVNCRRAVGDDEMSYKVRWKDVAREDSWVTGSDIPESLKRQFEEQKAKRDEAKRCRRRQLEREGPTPDNSSLQPQHATPLSSSKDDIVLKPGRDGHNWQYLKHHGTNTCYYTNNKCWGKGQSWKGPYIMTVRGSSAPAGCTTHQGACYTPAYIRSKWPNAEELLKKGGPWFPKCGDRLFMLNPSN